MNLEQQTKNAMMEATFLNFQYYDYDTNINYNISNLNDENTINFSAWRDGNCFQSKDFADFQTLFNFVKNEGLAISDFFVIEFE